MLPLTYKPTGTNADWVWQAKFTPNELCSVQNMWYRYRYRDTPSTLWDTTKCEHCHYYCKLYCMCARVIFSNSVTKRDIYIHLEQTRLRMIEVKSAEIQEAEALVNALNKQIMDLKFLKNEYEEDTVCFAKALQV